MSRFARVFPAGASSKFAVGARPTLVLDLDDTVLYRSRGVLDALLLYTVPTASVGVPFPGAVEAINRLARSYRIVAVTARWSMGATNTVRWLAAHGLAGLPLIHATRPHPGDASRIAFKVDAIAWLRDAGWQPVAGVGDRPSDLEAYARSGLLACIVAHGGDGGCDDARSAAAEAGQLGRAAARWRALRAAGVALPPAAAVAYFARHARDGAVARLLPDLGPELPRASEGDGGVWAQVEARLDAFAAELDKAGTDRERTSTTAVA